MDTVTLLAGGGALVALVLYLMRRRARLSREDD
jgi:hypothetical protein